MVRSVLGFGGYDLKLGGVTREHYELSIRALKNYTAVVPIDELSGSRFAAFLHRHYDRRSVQGDLPSIPQLHKVSQRVVGQNLSDQHVRLLETHNQWDLLL